MRFYFACDCCLTSVRLIGALDDIQALILNHPQWKQGYPCVNAPACAGQMEQVKDMDVLNALPHVMEQGLIPFQELSPQEFFRALCGFGMPKEIGCEPEVVTALLLSSKVTGVFTRPSASGRAIIQRISLENGTTLHLGQNPAGAVVYKITRTQNEASNGNPPLQPDGDDGSSPREDGGSGNREDRRSGQREGVGSRELSDDVDGRSDLHAPQRADEPPNSQDHNGEAGGEGTSRGQRQGKILSTGRGHDEPYQDGPGGGQEIVCS